MLGVSYNSGCYKTSIRLQGSHCGQTRALSYYLPHIELGIWIGNIKRAVYKSKGSGSDKIADMEVTLTSSG